MNIYFENVQSINIDGTSFLIIVCVGFIYWYIKKNRKK